MADKTGVFISYRRQSPSTHCANALRREIKRRYPGAEVFHDGMSLEAGAEWPERLRQALDGSAVLLALIDENWATVRKGARLRLDIAQDWVRRELIHAFETNTLVIPVLIDKVRLPENRDDLPEELHPIFDRQTRKLRDDPRDQENDLREIVEAVGKHLHAAAADAPAADPAPPVAADARADHISVEDAVALILEIAPGPRELYDLAIGRHDTGAYRLAELLFRASAEQFAEDAGLDDDWTLNARHNAASALVNQGKAAEAEAIFGALIPLREKAQGPEHLGTLAARHAHAASVLDQGKATEAESLFRELLSMYEKVHGSEHFFTLANRRQVARACLEQGAAERAWEALAPLPEDGGDPNPLRKGQTAMLRAWLADLDGDADRAEELLDEAEAHLAHLAPEHYARRDLAKYHETRVPGGPGGTMIWSPDAAR